MNKTIIKMKIMEGKMERKLELKDVVLVGRNFEEYFKMFNLKEIEKSKKILDVASGVSSFCKEATEKGYNVTSSDRIYCFSPDELEKKCEKDLNITIEKLSEVQDLYKWGFFKDITELKDQRIKAYKNFIEDFRQSERYVYTEYPRSNFKDNQFEVTLVSHFLFMYDEHFSYDFHKDTIKELMRITSKEIRIFPIVNLKGKKSLFVDELIKDKDFYNYKIEIKKVDYEFVKGGNEMLIIKVESKEGK